MGLRTATRRGFKTSMNSLTLTTCLGENTEPICKSVAGYFTDRLQIRVQYEGELSWEERSRRIDTGEIELGWICGLLYVQKVDDTAVPISPLVAPIMAGEAYRQQPIYTSKIIVRRGSDFHTFDDLRGTRFAINEPDSYSGCVLVQAYLAGLGETGNYFGEVVESGSHSQSIKCVVNGQVAAAAIDCTVLNYIITQYPQLQRELRVVKVLGPDPVPLWVISNTVPQKTTKKLKQLLINMAAEEDGRKILTSGNVARFTAVQDKDYDPIRQMAHQARTVRWVF